MEKLQIAKELTIAVIPHLSLIKERHEGSADSNEFVAQQIAMVFTTIYQAVNSLEPAKTKKLEDYIIRERNNKQD